MALHELCRGGGFDTTILFPTSNKLKNLLDYAPDGVLICDGGCAVEGCEKWPLALPAALGEERKHQSDPSRSHR